MRLNLWRWSRSAVRLRPADPAICALRRELERDLNDGPAQRVAALTVALGLASVDLGAPGRHGWITSAQDDLNAVLDELRDIGRVLYPPVLAGSGLGSTLRAVADRRGIALTLDCAGLDHQDQVAAGLAIADHVRTLPPDSRVRVRVRRGVRAVKVHVSTRRPVTGSAVRAQCE